MKQRRKDRTTRSLPSFRARYFIFNWIVLLTIIAMGGVLVSCSGDDGDSSTGPGDTTAPTVTKVLPADGATGVSLNTEVVITFSEAVNPATCTTNFVKLDQGVTGTVSVTGGDVTFTPLASLDTMTTYNLTVTSDVCDVAGNHLAQEFTSDFTTAGLPVADAGPDQLVNRNQPILLDASHSSGNSAQPLTYTWTQVAGPVTPVLTGATPSFTSPDCITVIIFSLVVTDEGIDSEPDLVKIMVMENKDHAFFVHPAGSDNNDGSIDAPFVTVQGAISAAVGENAGGDLYIAGGEYVGDVSLHPNISLYGGYNPDSWNREEPFVTTTIRGGAAAMVGTSANNLTLDGLTVESDDATAYGESSIALTLDGCVGVTVSHSHFKTGNGMIGIPGGDGDNGRPGNNGGSGSARTGGTGGSGPGYPGGNGGTGGPDWYGGTRGFDGTPAPPLGGYGGARGAYNSRGSNGGNGASALPGADGNGGASFGIWVNHNYNAAEGQRGQQLHGCGGGGGGGGGAEGTYNGGGGGGGGAGGEGGEGGEGGVGGGASIGIALCNGSNVVIEGCIITTGNGGNGGWGGEGGEGAIGGTGGYWGQPQDDGFWLEGEEGGLGGNGGASSKGGFGGGGGGGPVIGIYSYQSISVRSDDIVFNLGIPGVGSDRLDGFGNAGSTGEKTEYKSDI